MTYYLYPRTYATQSNRFPTASFTEGPVDPSKSIRYEFLAAMVAFTVRVVICDSAATACRQVQSGAEREALKRATLVGDILYSKCKHVFSRVQYTVTT
jgi:hypothetical protein